MPDAPKPYVMTPNAPIAKKWDSPLSEIATLPKFETTAEDRERHKIFSLMLFGLMKRFFNGNKNGARGEYPWRESQLDDDKARYVGGDYLGHNIGALAVDGRGEVIDFDFNHNQVYGSSAEHAEARLIRRVFSLTQIYDNWQTRKATDPPRSIGYSTLLSNVTVYTSLESCAQCSGIMALGQVGQVVYLQRDPGTYHIGNIMWNLTAREVGGGEAAQIKATAPRPIPGDEIGFKYFDELNDKYRDYFQKVKKKPFHVGKKRKDLSSALTSFLCCDETFDVYTRAQKEFLALVKKGAKYPKYRPKNGKREALTNAEVLEHAHQFYDYAADVGRRGTPHKL
jgi:tRNA(Arg) A34 adenosine deaminase TadA